MHASLDKTLATAVVLTERDLRSMHDRLFAFGGAVTTAFVGRDGISRTPEDIDALLAYENPKGREVVVLSFSCYRTEKSVSLKLGRRGDENIAFDARGPEEEIRALYDAIVDVVEGARPWYHRISRLNFAGIGFAIMAAFIVGVGLLATVLPNPPSEVVPKEITLTYVLPRIWSFGKLLLIFLSPLIVGTILDRLKKAYFPHTAFAIGQGQKRHSNLEWIRTSIIIGFIVSFLSGLLLWLFTR